MLTTIYLLSGLLLLYFGADYLVKGGASIAHKLKVPPLVVGLTLIAYGTSAPELVVSVDAAIQGLHDVSIGNIVGSNICNIALILGLCATITPLRVNPKLLRFDIPVMIASAVTLALVCIVFGGIGAITASIFLIGCIAYTVYSYLSPLSEDVEVPESSYSWLVSILMVMGGLVALVTGSKLLVNSSTTIAKYLGVPDAVIGLTIVAVGTSLPELVTSVVASIKHEQDIAIGNVVGSNIFNVLGILGVAPLFNPIQIQHIGVVDMLVMVAASAWLYVIMKPGLKISRRSGAALLLGYATYAVYLFFR